MSDKNLDLKSLYRQTKSQLDKLQRYSLVLFLVFIVILFSFVLFRVNSLKDADPSVEEVSSQVQAAQVPNIDEDIVKQLESLQDNSVSVQTLFNDARSNPF